jgi:hypothetical protein
LQRFKHSEVIQYISFLIVSFGDRHCLRYRQTKQQFQIQKTMPDTRPGVNSEADSPSPFKRTEPGTVVHSTRFNGFSL